MTESQSPRVRVLDEVGSTNDVLATLYAQGAEQSLSTVLTLNQTGGRGRLGRVWTAPPQKTVAVSVLVIPEAAGSFPFGWIPLIAGAAMYRSVDALVGAGRTGLKWPNDVQIDGLKVCGVLAEMLPGALAVVVGAGVNLTLSADELPVPTATSLALAGVTTRGDELVDAVVGPYLAVFRELLERLERAGGDAQASGIHTVVSESCRTLGRQVRVSLPGGKDLFGVATGIDSGGRLLVRSAGDDDTVAVAAGDVTHLRYE